MRQSLIRAVLLASLLASLLGGSAALACGNSMRLFMASPEDEQKLQQAQEHFAAGRCDLASPLITQVLDNSVGQADRAAYKIAGLCELKTGSYDAAREHLTVAVREYKNLPYVVAKLGEAEVALGAFDQALPRLEKLFKKSLLPDADSFVALARARAHRGDKAGALAAIDGAVALSPGDAKAAAVRTEVEAMPEPAKRKKREGPAKKSPDKKS